MHRNDPTSTTLSPDAQYIGLKGEEAFSIAFGVPMDLTLKHEGDGGKDFIVNGWRIGVRTARIPKYLIVEPRDIAKCGIWVLCKWNARYEEAQLLGWAWDWVMKAQPVKDIGGYGKLVHYLAASKLNAIGDLVSFFTRKE